MEGFWNEIDDLVSEISIEELRRFGVPELVVNRLLTFGREDAAAPGIQRDGINHGIHEDFGDDYASEYEYGCARAF